MELWARFQFHRGSCHRCERTGLPVACLGTMEHRGVAVDFMACHWCIFRTEQLHWGEAERARLSAGGELPEQPSRPHPPTRRRLCIPGVPLRVRRPFRVSVQLPKAPEELKADSDSVPAGSNRMKVPPTSHRNPGSAGQPPCSSVRKSALHSDGTLWCSRHASARKCLGADPGSIPGKGTCNDTTRIEVDWCSNSVQLNCWCLRS